MSKMHDSSIVHQAPAVPGTHVLIVGVGQYHHLRGGSGPLLGENQGLGQLSSPPVSARELASWFIGHFRSPQRPLASVRLLVSEAVSPTNPGPLPFTNPRTNVRYPPARATIDNIEGAFKAWFADGNTHEDNLLIFYFCGHGIGNGKLLALLAEDFGSDPTNALDGAIDFHKNHGGMKQCKALHQCYLIDACRTDAQLLRYADEFGGRVFVCGGKGGGLRPILFSTLKGQPAHGRANQASHFAQALISGFKGAGGDRSEGDWRIKTTTLSRAVETFMARRIAAGLASAQTPPADELTSFDLHFLDSEPEVPVIVSCDPSHADPVATFRCEAGGRLVTDRPPAPGPWEIDLVAGSYDFEARFVPASGFNDKRKDNEYVHPPQQKIPLRVRP